MGSRGCVCCATDQGGRGQGERGGETFARQGGREEIGKRMRFFLGGFRDDETADRSPGAGGFFTASVTSIREIDLDRWRARFEGGARGEDWDFWG